MLPLSLLAMRQAAISCGSVAVLITPGIYRFTRFYIRLFPAGSARIRLLKYLRDQVKAAGIDGVCFEPFLNFWTVCPNILSDSMFLIKVRAAKYIQLVLFAIHPGCHLTILQQAGRNILMAKPMHSMLFCRSRSVSRQYGSCSNSG